MAQSVVIDQVFIAERLAEPPPAQHAVKIVRNPPTLAAALEAGGKAVDQTDRFIGRAEQQGASVRGASVRGASVRGDSVRGDSVRGDRATIEIRDRLASFKARKVHRI
ncbi:MAG: hypothetical protein RIC87_09600 [Kiloniellales bacterium]